MARTIKITDYISDQQERARTIHITVYQISQISRRGLEQYTLLSIRYLRVVGEGQYNTHYCLLDISEQQERARTIHITVYQISQISRRGLEQYTLLSIRYLRVVGEGQYNTHYCLLDITEQQESARTIHITVYQISQSSRRGLEQYTLLSIRYLRVVGEGQNNTHYMSIRYLRVVGEGQNITHYCLLDISEQQERPRTLHIIVKRARTIHITVYQISQSSRRGLEQYTLLSIRYLRVVGEGQNNRHYCLLDITEWQERARTIHITVYQISQISRRGLEQYTLLSIRYLRVVGEGQNNTHYCLLDISEQQERARTIHITVYQISQISRRGLEQYTLLSIRYLSSSRRGLEHYTLLSIRYLRQQEWARTLYNTHYCLLDISDQQERARTIHITVYQISQSSRRGLEQYTLLSIRYLRVVGKGQNNRHYCLLDISEQQERARTIHITVYQISQSSRRGLEQYTLLSIRYLRVVGKCQDQNNTHYCLLDISEQQKRARTIHITDYQISQSSRRGLEQQERARTIHITVYQISQSSREGQNITHYCLLDISEQQERARTIHITVYQISQEQQERARTIHITVYQISQSSRRTIHITVYQLEQQGRAEHTLLSIRYLRVVGEGQNNTHYCLLDISDQQERARKIHIVFQISQSSRRGLEQYTLLSIRYLSIVGECQNNTHYCLLDISEQQERARTIHITVYQSQSIRYLRYSRERARTIHISNQISQSSRRGHIHITVYQISRVVGECQDNTHYCLLDISEQQKRARTIHITDYQISQSSRRGLEQYTLQSNQISRSRRRGLEHYTLLSIRYLSVVGKGQNNTHYCLLDISEQQERARTIHITVYQISQSSRKGLEQQTLLSIRYLRVVGEGQNNTHYCLLDISDQQEREQDITVYYISLVREGCHISLLEISEQQERARTIHITVYQISQSSRRGQNNRHYCLLLRVVGEGRTINITVYQISQISRRGEQYTLLLEQYTIHITVYQISQSSRRGLEQYTLLSIRYLRVVGKGQNNRHYCLLDISDQQERARTIHITVYQISQSSRRGQYNTHYCLLDITEQQESARTIHITVYQISQSSRRGQEQYTLLTIRYLRVVGEGQNNKHYSLIDISEQKERARTLHITVYQISQCSREGLEQYTLLSIRYLGVVGEGQNNTYDCLLDISEQQERARTTHITVYQISQSSRRGLEHTHYCLLDISEQQERARTIHITVYQISQSGRKGIEQQY